MCDFDEEEERQALRLSELSSEEFDRQVRALDQPKTDTTSNNGAGAQKESSSDFAAAGPNSALQAFEDIQLNLATSELLQEELPAGAYEEQILQLLLQLNSQPEHEALESAMQGDTLLEQVEETEDVEFLERSLAALLLSTDICSGDHSDEPASLSILGIGLLARFQRVGDLGDLEHGIDANRRAVDLTPDSHPDKPMYLNILGNGLFLRFERLGELRDLECAIDANRRAVDLTPDDHPDKPVHLNSLGSGFQRRFDHVGELRDLEYGIDANRRAVYLTPNGHPNKPGYLSNLAIGLFHRFEHLGELGDLEHGLNANRRAVDLTPDGHPDKPGRLNNLGSGFLISFEHVGNLEDLERAIDASRRAAGLTPNGHPDKPGYLSNLGNGFIRHFERHGELGDLERAIDASRRAVELTPGNHPDKPRYLNNLGNCFRSRFERYGNLGDLESAIDANLHAVNLTPNDHPDKPAILDNFGNSLLGRFERVGELGDLERAIDASCRAVDLTPDGHPDKPGRLSSLGNGFLTRFGRGGELGDLEHAIDAIRRAADLTPDGHPHKPMNLNNLGNSFLTRFERVGEREDLERAIDASRHAVDLTPNGHPDKPMYLHNLGNGFFLRFERVGELEDLERAIDASLRAVDLTPDSHDHKPVHLNSLGNGFLIRFERVGELRDLEFAIDASRRAVNLTPDGHPRKPMHLNSLGSGFFLRFERVGEIEDLERAIDATQRAVNLTPDDHPDKPGYLNNLGSGFQRRFGHVGGPGDLQDVLKVYLRAADQQSGPPTIRLKAVKQWADICWAGLRYDLVTHDELVSVYERAITLIPQVAWLGKSIGQRFEELTRISQLVNGAVAAAIEAGQLTRAVEWFDQGRGVVWGQLLQLRNPLDDLRAIRPELAEDLQTISHDLEKSSGLSARRQSLQDQAADRILQDEASQRIRLAEKRDDVLKAIRNINGFDRFLMPKLYPTLARASEGGPVILINVHESRCDALIICSPAEDLIHLSLSKLSPEDVTDMHQQFLSLLQQAGVRGRGDEDADGSDDYRAVKPYTFHKADFSDILSRLWLCVVHPVLEAIKEKLRSPIINALPHVTWCATGALAFLPLHAAGEYGLEGGRKVFDFVVSSYTPTLSTLLQTSASLADVSSKSNKILVISQPQTPGQCSLPAALEEVAKIRQHFTEDQVIHKNGADAEVNAVLGAINDYHPQCIHFACHGVQDANDPASSAFFLHDAKLELRQLMATSEAGAKLAFLSACQTAKGDVKLPEEAVHLAAGMLSVGCQAVVGTLWSIKDKDAPVVADEFYRRLRENEADSSKEGRAHVAYALHGAAEVLRRKVGESEFLRWAAFVHLGQ